MAFVSESGDVGVDETFHGKFGERVEDLVVRLGLLLLPPARLPRATRTLTRTLTLTLTDTLTLIHPTTTPTPPSPGAARAAGARARGQHGARAHHRAGGAVRTHVQSVPPPRPRHSTTPPTPPLSLSPPGQPLARRAAVLLASYCPLYNTPGAACCAPTCSVQNPPRWRSAASPTPPSSRRLTRRSRPISPRYPSIHTSARACAWVHVRACKASP